jgi:hypothetical protein
VISPWIATAAAPVSTLAANETAARASMYTPRLTPTSTAKAVKRDAKPEYLPCRLSRMTAGAPEGGASPARAVMAPPWAAAGQAGRAGRCTGGGAGALSSGAMNSSSPTVWLRTTSSTGLQQQTERPVAHWAEDCCVTVTGRSDGGHGFGRLSAGLAVPGRSAAFPVPRYPQAMASIDGTPPLPGSNSGSAGPLRQAPAVWSTEPVSTAGSGT